MADDEQSLSNEELKSAIFPADASRAIDSVDHSTVTWKCPKCGTETQFRTKGVEFDADGIRQQRLECVQCETNITAPTGADGSEYQPNLDTPDHTGFDGL